MQRHRTGCAVASLAMLLDISYNKAMQVLHPKRKQYQRVTGDIWKISKALKYLKKNFTVHSNLGTLFGNVNNKVDIKSLKNPALLCLYTVDIVKGNHAVVWDPETQKVLDPGRKKNMPISFYQKRLTFAFELA